MCMHTCTNKYHRTIFWSLFCPSTMWGPGFELRSSDLAARPLSPLACPHAIFSLTLTPHVPERKNYKITAHYSFPSCFLHPTSLPYVLLSPDLSPTQAKRQRVLEDFQSPNTVWLLPRRHLRTLCSLRHKPWAVSRFSGANWKIKAAGDTKPGASQPESLKGFCLWDHGVLSGTTLVSLACWGLRWWHRRRDELP